MNISWGALKKLGAILGMAITGLPGSWFFWQYQKPRVICYSDEYYVRVNDLLIGSIWVANEGRSPETNLTISVGEKLLPADIAVNYLSSEATISEDESS